MAKARSCIIIDAFIYGEIPIAKSVPCESDPPVMVLIIPKMELVLSVID